MTFTNGPEPDYSNRPHECYPPEGLGKNDGAYFECECGKDFVFRLPHWKRVHWWNRGQVRAYAGVDEKCPQCGPRSYRTYKRWMEQSARAGGSVMVGYLCRRHEEGRLEYFRRNPINMFKEN